MYLQAIGPKVILDVGAADGTDTIEYALAFPDATVHAFEPLPSNFELLTRAVKSHDLAQRVFCHPIALSDREGELDFWVSGGQEVNGMPWPYSSSLLEPEQHPHFYPAITFAKSTAKSRRLEHYADEVGIGPIDFIHADIQGAELAMLAGAGRRLDRLRGIWMEVESVPLYRAQPLKADVAQFMTAAGFKLKKDTVGDYIFGDQFWAR
jgi:FkbM family methyltransferase